MLPLSEYKITDRTTYYFELLKPLDKIINGIKETEMIVITARAGVGKTNFALNMLYNLNLLEQKVLLESVEMEKAEILERLQKMDQKFKFLDYEKIFVDDTARISINTIEKNIKETKPAVVIVDYIQLMEGNIKDNSRELKILAKKYKLPIIVLSQLNRLATNVKEPNMAMISESGRIECDANIVIIISKEYVIVDKNRRGRTGKIKYWFEPKKLWFHLMKEEKT